MNDHNKDKQMQISSSDIAELTAIYDDYLYMVRQHELLLHQESIDNLAFMQVKYMYPECEKPQNFTIPWHIEKLDVDEKQKFKKFAENDIDEDKHSAYIFLQHINDDENYDDRKSTITTDYKNFVVAMQFPSMVEDYTLFCPENATLGNTKFYIDGRYKAVYAGQKYKDKLLENCITDKDLETEITFMVILGECFRKNGYADDDKFGRMAVNVYAAEVVGTNENNLLEMLCSFAEKVKNICHEKYHEKDALNSIKKAQETGFLRLPDNFRDYVNIRNLLRHQWDTIDEPKDFSTQKAANNRKIRAERTNSYIKLCDKSIYQRMTSCIEVLHQMQQIIVKVNPLRIIREAGESNNKFAERVKALSRQYPDKLIEAEINHPLISPKYEALNRILHKKKIFPNVKVCDDFSESSDKFELMEDYKKRSFFLRSSHGIECVAMGYCERCGKETNNRGAWFFMNKAGLITDDECQTWQDYITLRNDMAHNYFSANLRKRLNDITDKYSQDLQEMMKKIGNAQEIYKADKSANTTHAKENEKHNNKTFFRREIYRNGIEYSVQGDVIGGVKLPNGVYINMIKRSIDWGDKTRLYTNAEYSNYLQTEKSKLRTDKNLRLKEYYEGNRKITFYRGDKLSVDNRHKISLDATGHIKEFDFKSLQGKIIKTEFANNATGNSQISFEDGTHIYISNENISVSHNGKKLSYDTRKEFAVTYDILPRNRQQIKKSGNER